MRPRFWFDSKFEHCQIRIDSWYMPMHLQNAYWFPFPNKNNNQFGIYIAVVEHSCAAHRMVWCGFVSICAMRQIFSTKYVNFGVMRQLELHTLTWSLCLLFSQMWEVFISFHFISFLVFFFCINGTAHFPPRATNKQRVSIIVVGCLQK